MGRDQERRDRNREALRDSGIDAIVCALPMNVLLLSGYWPVVGTSLAISTRDDRSILLVPEDEEELAEGGWADEIHTFSPGSMHELKGPAEAVSEPLQNILSNLQIQHARICYESDAMNEPASYASMNLYGAAVEEILRTAFPKTTLIPAGSVLTLLRSTLTEEEIEKLKVACSIARVAYCHGKDQLRSGLRETEAAAAFRMKLSDPDPEHYSVKRADGFTFCMSGKNSFDAFAAFQRSRARKLEIGD